MEVARQSGGAAAGPSVLHLIAPAAVGGLESVVVTLASAQHRRGRDVRVAAVVEPSERPHPVVERLRSAGVPADALRVAHRAYLQEIRAVRSLLDRRDPEVVHTHGYRCDVVGARVAKSAGYPVVSTVHGFTGGGWKNRFFERLQRRSLRSIDRVVAVAQPLTGELRAAGVPPDRIECVPNAWEVEHPPLPRREARARLSLPDDAFVVGWVGRLSPEKGPDVLLRAMARRSEGGGIAALIGEGPGASRLRRLAEELGTADRVRWFGRVPRAAAIYPAFDVFALSSRTEGTPIALFEAMEAEVPVVATRVGGVPDVVTEAEAWLVDPDDPEDLARALDAVQEDSVTAGERAVRAKQRLRARFGLVPWLDRYDEVYGAVCEGRGEVRA